MGRVPARYFFGATHGNSLVQSLAARVPVHPGRVVAAHGGRATRPGHPGAAAALLRRDLPMHLLPRRQDHEGEPGPAGAQGHAHGHRAPARAFEPLVPGLPRSPGPGPAASGRRGENRIHGLLRTLRTVPCEKLRDWRAGVHGKRTGSWNGQKQYLLCVNCHNPHSPHFQPLKPMPPPVPPSAIQARKGAAS